MGGGGGGVLSSFFLLFRIMARINTFAGCIVRACVHGAYVRAYIRVRSRVCISVFVISGDVSSHRSMV